MDRLFLDANVLFSAAYRDGSALLELLTSAYAFEEARRDLDLEKQRLRLHELMRGPVIVPESAVELPAGVELSDKDLPILPAAIAAESSHLITGDRADFGPYFGKELGEPGS